MCSHYHERPYDDYHASALLHPQVILDSHVTSALMIRKDMNLVMRNMEADRLQFTAECGNAGYIAYYQFRHLGSRRWLQYGRFLR